MTKEHSNPVQNVIDQQKSLDIAIKQHANEPEIQASLRKQKDALGAFIADYKDDHDTPNDGGNVAASEAANAGNKNYAVGGEPIVRVSHHVDSDEGESK